MGKKTQLKCSRIRIAQDFPTEIVAQHNALIPIIFEACKMNMKAFLVAEKLVIDNKSYTVNTLNTLPDSLCTSEIGIRKVTNNITAFYGSMCWLSNFIFMSFTDNKGVYYHSSEQFLHHQKAIIFNDPMSAANIPASKTPSECKSLGGRVENFEIERWKRHAKDIMQIGLTLKFSQNKLCFKALEATGKTTLVEASAMDKSWGVGLNLKDTKTH